MGLNIIDVTIGAESDRRASLSNALVVRPLEIGSAWDQAVLIMLCNTAAVGGGVFRDIPAAALRLGFCNGTDAVYGDQSIHHFWGMYIQNTATFNNGGTCDYYTGGTNLYYRRIQNGSDTLIKFEGISGTERYLSGDGTVARTLLGISIDKSNASAVTGTFFWRDSAASDPADVDFDELITAVTGGGLPSPYVETNNSMAGGPHAIDEATYGGLDSVMVGFGSATQRLEISGLAVYTT